MPTTPLQRMTIVCVMVCLVGTGLGASYSTVITQQAMVAALAQAPAEAIQAAAPAPRADAPPPEQEFVPGWRPWHVPLSVDGYLVGKLSQIEPGYLFRQPAEAVVVQIARDGAIATEAKTGPGGVYQASGLQPGEYSILTSSRVGFLAGGTYVVEPVPGAAAEPLALDLTLAAAADASALLELARQMPPGGVPLHGQIVPLEEFGQVNGPEGVAFAMRLDGTIRGRLVDVDRLNARAVRGARVLLLRNGHVVAEAPTSEQGLFRITRGVEPGFYSFVAIGPGAFAALGVQVVAPGARAGVGGSPADTQYVAFQDGAELPMTISIMQPADLPLLQPALSQFAAQTGAMPPGPPPPFGGGGGGFGGGGAAGGGGGDLLGALLAGGIGGAIGALAADDGGGKGVKSPAVP